MFDHLFHLVTRRPAAGCETVFVNEVRVIQHLPERNPRARKLLFTCWVLIAGKCWLVTWLVGRYHMGFSPWWVTAPTLVFALMCTALYFAHE